jgi:hypothetical protein
VDCEDDTEDEEEEEEASVGCGVVMPVFLDMFCVDKRRRLDPAADLAFAELDGKLRLLEKEADKPYWPLYPADLSGAERLVY